MRDANRQSAYSSNFYNHQSTDYVKTVLVNLRRILLVALIMVGFNPAVADDSRESVMSDKAVTSLLLDITYAGDRLVAVGDRGHVLYSDDDGKSWTQGKVPTTKMLVAVSFVDDKNGWAVGHDALILNTTDSGETWTQQYSDPDAEVPLLDVWFRNAREGYVVGPYGYFMKTSDGGKTWDDWKDSINNEEELHFNSITSLKNGTLFISGEAGMLYRSLDGGDTFEMIESPYDGSFFGVIPTQHPDTALVYGLRGHLFRTVDNGVTWEEIKTGTDYGLFGGALLSDGTMAVVGDNGSIVRSTDNGSTVSLKSRSNRMYISSVIQASNGNLILVGQGGIHTVGSDGAELAPQAQ